MTLRFDVIGSISFIVSLAFLLVSIFFVFSRDGIFRKIIIALFGALSWLGFGHWIMYSNKTMDNTVFQLVVVAPVLFATAALITFILKYPKGKKNDR